MMDGPMTLTPDNSPLPPPKDELFMIKTTFLKIFTSPSPSGHQMTAQITGLCGCSLSRSHGLFKCSRLCFFPLLKHGFLRLHWHSHWSGSRTRSTSNLCTWSRLSFTFTFLLFLAGAGTGNSSSSDCSPPSSLQRGSSTASSAAWSCPPSSSIVRAVAAS